MASEICESEKLTDLFNKVWTLYHEIDSTSEPTSSVKLQSSINEAIEQILFLTKSIEQLSMFSVNEELEEVATSDLRYFLLHPLASCLISKKQCDAESRPNIIEKSLEHFRIFLKLCLSYDFGRAVELENVLNNLSSKENLRQKTDLNSMAAAREAKIAKYRKSKERAQQIVEYEKKLHDEEVARKYWLLQIDKWIDCAIEDISSMKTELDMLIRFKGISKEDQIAANEPKKPPIKPFILTKDKLQATVFGAGYPSLPTMTLEEYFEKEAAAGRMPDQPMKPQNGNHPTETISENSDDDSIQKQRDFDDWKDTHRRGAGNRHNMG